MLLFYSNALLPHVNTALWQVPEELEVQSTPAVAISVFSFQFLLWLKHSFLMPALNELYLPELICWILNCIQFFAQQPNLSNIYCSLYLAPSLSHTRSFHCYVCFSGNKL